MWLKRRTLTKWQVQAGILKLNFIWTSGSLILVYLISAHRFHRKQILQGTVKLGFLFCEVMSKSVGINDCEVSGGCSLGHMGSDKLRLATAL